MIRVGSSEDHGLALAAIQIDGGTQSRASLNDHVVNEYAEAIKAGATFPPIIVFYDGKKHWLADGFHRFHAYQKAGRTNIPADVRQGTRRDAILHSVGANETHGLRRTRDDKRRAVLTLLNDAEWSAKPETWIAETCRVSRSLVRTILAEQPHLVEKQDRSTVREVTRGGKTYSMQTAAIGKAGGAEPEEITSEALAPQGVYGGAEPEKPVEEITHVPDAVGDTDAIRAGHITQYHVMQLRGAWSKANTEARAIFLAEIQPSNPEPDDVDRSAERASSAVEVGAPVSPEGAQGSVPADTRLPSSLAAREADESAAPISPSAAHPVEAVADNPQVPRPSAAAKEFPDPQYSGVATADPAHQVPKLSGAKSDVPHVVGQGCTKQVESFGHSGHEPAGKPQDGNSAVSGKPASVINPKPDCLKLKDGHCRISSATSALCSECNNARMKARAGA